MEIPFSENHYLLNGQGKGIEQGGSEARTAYRKNETNFIHLRNLRFGFLFGYFWPFIDVFCGVVVGRIQVLLGEGFVFKPL